MAAENKDTSPMMKARRIERQVRIQEMNDPPTALFDTTVEYPSTDLPEWFQGLQSIVEDETFTSMVINLGDKVRYRITIVEQAERDELARPSPTRRKSAYASPPKCSRK